MRTLGIIAEYNPFHEGHSYLIRNAVNATGADCVISVMSGNFTQRGEPALYDKWERTRKALSGGVDLILELPVVFALGSAEQFALGGIGILEGMGTDFLAFGSESGDLVQLEHTADILRMDAPALQEEVRKNIKKGESYPRARMNAFLSLYPDADTELFTRPNNILALEYLKQRERMIPWTIERRGGYHQQASKLREEARMKEPARFRKMEGRLFDFIRLKVLQSSGEELDALISGGNGLGRRLKNAVFYAENLEDLTRRVKTKGYTRTRIRRLMLQAVIGLTQTDQQLASQNLYARILGFSEKGRAFLHQRKKEGNLQIPLLTNINKTDDYSDAMKKILEKDILSSDIYNIINDAGLYRNSDHVLRPVPENQ